MMAHAQKPDFVFLRNGRVHLKRQGRQFSRLPAAEVCASAVVMLDTPCCEVVCTVLAIHPIRLFPLHFPNPCVTVSHHISTGLYLLGSVHYWHQVSVFQLITWTYVGVLIRSSHEVNKMTRRQVVSIRQYASSSNRY